MKHAAPNISIPKQNVTGVSGEQVTQTTWNPNDGFARSLEIEKERQREMEAYREQQTREHPVFGRFIRLEEQVAELQKKVDDLSQSNKTKRVTTKS